MKRLLTLLALTNSILAQTFSPNGTFSTNQTLDAAGLAINPKGQFDLSQVGTLSNSSTYMNPISTVNLGDPYMLYHDSWYYFTFSTNDNITIKRSRSLTSNWDFAEAQVVFAPNASSRLPWSTDLWAPELHNINDKWYIIFTATPDADNPYPLQDAMCPINCPAINHRMFVLESSSSDPWTSNYTLKGMLDTFDQFAIDGTYFTYNSQLYHIYSCWQEKYSAWPANLCITKLSDPWTVTSPLYERRMISVPDQPWEQVPYGRPIRLATNEGPQQLTNPNTGQQFVIYSAARVDTPFYCLGMLELVGNDPMQYQSWKKHTEGCVFHQNTQEGVYGTGHASFTTSPDGSETWMVYHAQTTDNPTRKLRYKNRGVKANDRAANLYRTARTQKIEWNEDGTPAFPLALNGPFPTPAGQ